MIASDKTREIDAVRLVMLYALRYEKHSNNDVTGLVDALGRRGVNEKLKRVSSCIFPCQNVALTHCGLLTPHDDIELGQHWLS